jgi:outer membrane protein OmpA-like peptidoglycan-associated protein
MHYVLLITALLFMGCSQPKTVTPPAPAIVQTGDTVGAADENETIVLLLDNHKKSNAIVVHSKTDSVLIDTDDAYVALKSAQSRPTEPKIMEKEKIDALFAKTLEALPQKPQKFILYFELGSAALDQKSLQLLQNVVDSIKKRQPCELAITGYADSKGNALFNKRLSMKRVENTLAWIQQYELDLKSVTKIYKGEESLIIPTDDEVQEPLNRRVELYIR